ncbi:MAG: twin-arginine translocase TatA/TatE family subunit [Thermomicrobiales bacterium]
MAGLGWQEMVIVLLIVMIIFGGGKLPDVVKSLGQGVKAFREEAEAPVVPDRKAPIETATSVESAAPTVTGSTRVAERDAI